MAVIGSSIPKMPKLPKPVTVENANVRPVPTSNLPEKPKAYGYEDLPWQQKLEFFQSNPDAAQFDIERSQNKANLQKSTGDTKGYDASTHWINQINTAIGPQVSQSFQPKNPQQERFEEFQNKQSDLMKKYESMMDQPLNYNPESDPRFQAYQTLYNKQAEQASRQSMETMNDRGILNSTVTSDRLGQIQQDAQGRAMAHVPEFYAQAQQERNDQLSNVGSLLGMYGDEARYSQDINYRNERDAVGDQRHDQQFGYQQQRDQIGDQRYDQQFEYQGARDAIADERYKVEFDQDNERFGLQYALNKAMQQGQLDISRMNAATSRMSADTSRMSANASMGNAQFNQAMELWKTTGSAPAGIPGVTEGSPYPQEEQKPEKLGANEITADIIANLDAAIENIDETTGNKHTAEDILKNEKATIIRDIGISGYNSLVRMYVDDPSSDLLRSIIDGN